MKEKFCNDCSLTSFVPRLVAEELLGKEQLSLIETRYRVMRENYDGKAASKNEYNMIDVIKCTHSTFKPDFEKIGKGAIGLDLPTWFNIGSNKRIMLISQDPLRDKKKYGEFRNVILSSPFGLHDATYRVKSNKGLKMYELVKRLVDGGYGVYLTDARKFFVYDRSTSDTHAESRVDEYADILKKEIEAVDPSLFVCLGRQAERTFIHMKFGESLIELPHLSWRVSDARKQRFPELIDDDSPANIAEQYAKAIIGKIAK